MAKENDNPDGGYDHFHEHGTKSPGKLVKGMPDKRAPNSGPGGMGKGPTGKPPGLPSMPTANMADD
jgi:hypothetical protein